MNERMPTMRSTTTSLMAEAGAGIRGYDTAMVDSHLLPNAADLRTSYRDDPILRDVYVPLAEVPLVAAAAFAGGNQAVHVTLSTRDHAANSWLKTRFDLGLHWTKEPSRLLPSDALDSAQIRAHVQPFTVAHSASAVPAVPASDDTVKAAWTSPDTRALKVILRESTVAASSLKEGGGKRRTVEVWNGHRCTHRVDVTKKHGSFATDDTFGTLDVNTSNGKVRVLYTAESNLETWEDPNDDLAQYDYRPAFGEKLAARVRTTLFMVDTSEASVHELKLTNDAEQYQGSVAAKSVFAVDGRCVFATVFTYTGDGRRLGQVYCTNRPSSLHALPLPSSSKWTAEISDKTRVSPVGFSVSAPCAVPNGVLFLGVREGGAHNSCCALFRANGQEVDTVVPIPDEGAKLESGRSWPGLYVQSLPTFALLTHESKHYLTVTSTVRSRRTPILIELGEGPGPAKVVDLCPSTESADVAGTRLALDGDHTAQRRELETEVGAWSYNVLNTNLRSDILAVRSRPNVPHQLVLGSLFGGENADSSPRVVWTVLWRADDDYAGEPLFKKLEAVQSSIVDIKKAAKGVQSIVVQPPLAQSGACDDAPPFILFPHGGPHSATTIDWSPSVSALAILGYAIALPNYSGSLGVSPKFVNSLLGNCGELDVADCFATAEQLVAQGVASPDQMYITGGSHGGFLTAHMVARRPKQFKAAVMRNPVIAVGQQAVTSDIEDWCFAEFGEPFSFAKPPVLRPDVFQRLEEQSPIAHMHKIEAPVLLLIGLKDLRVPPWSQGRVLYHALKERKHPVRMLTFKDADHALDTLEAESISLLSTVRWFREADKKASSAA